MNAPTEIRRAYLANKIMQLAFSPEFPSGCAQWLWTYHATVCDFWESARCPQPPKYQQAQDRFCGVLEAAPVEVCFEYELRQSQWFRLQLAYSPGTERRELMWTHESDPQYFAFPYGQTLDELGRAPECIGQLDSSDYEAVVDGLICHPRTHIHIEEPDLDHSLRIGEAMGNPLLLLFHLRFQACVIPEKRREERGRLCHLFSEAISSRAEAVSPSCLFGL